MINSVPEELRDDEQISFNVSMLSGDNFATPTTEQSATPPAKKKYTFRRMTDDETKALRQQRSTTTAESQQTNRSTSSLSNPPSPFSQTPVSTTSSPFSTIFPPTTSTTSSSRVHTPTPVHATPTSSALPTPTLPPATSSSSSRSKRKPSTNDNNGKHMFLVTYSQANMTRFPTRQKFAKFVVAAFNSGKGKVQVDKWAVCREEHENGGYHYHCCVKMKGGVKRWGAPRAYMAENGVDVDISCDHDHYVSMYRYVMKSDKDAVDSDNNTGASGHLQMISSPRNQHCLVANRKRRSAETASTDSETTTQTSAEKPRSRNLKLNHLDVAEFVIKNSISSTTQLFAAANRRKTDGESDLALYMMANSKVRVEETIMKAWDMHNAEKMISEESKTRLSRLESAYEESCASEDCEWLSCAKEVLRLNKIDLKVFAKAFYDCMLYGRQKFRNIMLIGRTNTAKTFMLKPLQQIFGDKLFENPSGKYGWMGIQSAQVVLLNDFRYRTETIPWSDFLLLLEGRQ